MNGDDLVKNVSKSSDLNKIRYKIYIFIAIQCKYIYVVLMISVILFLTLSLFSYNSNDPTWWSTRSKHIIYNCAGTIGANVAGTTLIIFGAIGFFIPFLLIHIIWVTFFQRKQFTSQCPLKLITYIVGVILLLISSSGLVQIIFSFLDLHMPEGIGGFFGQEVKRTITQHFNTTGSILVLSSTIIVGLILVSNNFFIWLNNGVLLFSFVGSVKNYLNQIYKEKMANSKNYYYVLTKDGNIQQEFTGPNTKILGDVRYRNLEIIYDFCPGDYLQYLDSNNCCSKASSFIYNPIQTELYNSSISSQKYIIKDKVLISGNDLYDRKYHESEHHWNIKVPSLNLLDSIKIRKKKSRIALDEMVELIENKLSEFGLKVKVVGKKSGPVITLFEIALSKGLKVNKLKSLAIDMRRVLLTDQIRIINVIPGKPYVGLEVPNQYREIIHLKEILSDKRFVDSTEPLTIGLGMDTLGNPKIANLANMPHLLLAGTTGSGKSISLHAIIISMLYKAPPDNLRLIMIDPKIIELSAYEGIPHLLTPVITDTGKAVEVLYWCIEEMERRYKFMAKLGVRNIKEFNNKVSKLHKPYESTKKDISLNIHEKSYKPSFQKKFAHIVIIIDEFSEVIMMSKKKIEGIVIRLAQKSRAAGIHLILATQRPSADIITGLIKSNIPTRIAFQVSSRIDSRIILDQHGAEELLGKGDMLYLSADSNIPVRLHGAFVSKNEVDRVISAWKSIEKPHYVDIAYGQDKEKRHFYKSEEKIFPCSPR